MKAKFTICLWLLSLTSFAQSFQKLQADTKKIYDANYNMDFEAVAELTYPKAYEVGGKTAFAEKIDTDYQNDDFRMRLELVEPVFQYSEMRTAASKKIYIITYKNPTRYFFEKKMDATTANQKAVWLKEITQAYEVIVEPKRNSVNVKRNSKLIAISDESTNGEWRFINWDDLVQRKLLDAVLDASVKKELGF